MIETEHFETKKSSNSTIIDDKLKLLFGSLCFSVGRPIAIECSSAVNTTSSADDSFTPTWRKMHDGEMTGAIPVNPSPNILFINEFKPNDLGVYVCRTKNVHGRVVDVGVEFRKDVNNASIVVVKSMEESLTDTTGEGEDEEGEETEIDNDKLPNIRITFSDKLALARGERVQLVCDSGLYLVIFYTLKSV